MTPSKHAMGCSGDDHIVERFERIERPYPWERKMTVCIAAICKNGDEHKIILCSDWRRSTALGHSDTMLKQRLLPHGWICMPSGMEGDILALVRLFEQELKKEEIIDETNIKKVVLRALNLRKKEKADVYTNGKFALSYDDFVEIGKEKFPPELYRSAMFDIRTINLGASFLIAGFVGNFPHVLETDKYCDVIMVEEFAAIGEGAHLASASLYQRQYIDLVNFNYALYCVFEAKKHAERVSSVGESTSIGVISSDGTNELVNKAGQVSLKAMYGKYGPKDVPQDIEFDSNLLEKFGG